MSAKADDDLNKLNKKRGGPRPHSGPKKGAKYAKTIAKEQAREIVREIITRELEPLLEAQIANAIGVRHFLLRNQTTGKLQRITDPAVIDAALNEGEEGSYYWIYTKDPNVQAFTDLMNRALDKPAEHVHQEIDVNVSQERVDRLNRALQRMEEHEEHRIAGGARRGREKPW
jgi:hypothetical protein